MLDFSVFCQKITVYIYAWKPLLIIIVQLMLSWNLMGFPVSAEGKESACNAGDPSLIPGLGRSLGEGNGNPLQYSCLETSMDRWAWWATVYKESQSRQVHKGCKQSDMTEWLTITFPLEWGESWTAFLPFFPWVYCIVKEVVYLILILWYFLRLAL